METTAEPPRLGTRNNQGVAHDEPKCVIRRALRAEEKWFLLPGAKGTAAPWYLPITSALISKNLDEGAIQDAVRRTFDVIDTLQNKKITAPAIIDVKSKSVIGILRLDSWINWFELEDSNLDVSHEIIRRVNAMRDYYEALLKYS